MSAGIMTNDWMFSGNGIRPWHGIGTVITGTPTSDEAIRLAKLDWDVIQLPVYAQGDIQCAGYWANVRSDTNEALGIVKDRYKVLQNREAFSFVDDIMSEGGGDVRYETAGSLYNGRRVFMVTRLPNMTIAGDAVENYLFFTTSHDGSGSFMAGISNVRVVCNNTLQLAMKTATRSWKCRHTESIQGKRDEAKQSLGLAVKYMGESKALAEEMARKLINEEQFFRNLFDKSNYKEKNSEELVLRVHDIYHKKDDLANFRGTAWGMYNAVADFLSNGEPLRKSRNYEQKKLEGFFDGYTLLNKAQDILLSA